MTACQPALRELLAALRACDMAHSDYLMDVLFTWLDGGDGTDEWIPEARRLHAALVAAAEAAGEGK